MLETLALPRNAITNLPDELVGLTNLGKNLWESLPRVVVLGQKLIHVASLVVL